MKQLKEKANSPFCQHTGSMLGMYLFRIIDNKLMCVHCRKPLKNTEDYYFELKSSVKLAK
jgi:hypothetical protein